MSRKRGAMLAISAVCALIAAAGIYRMLSREQTVEADVRPPASIVVAKTELPRGTMLQPEHLELLSEPAGTLPEGAFRQPRLLIGRTVKQSVAAGAPILQGALASTQSMLDARLLPGYRAVGVFVDGRGGLQRYLQAGDRVDVIVTIDNKDAGSSSRVVLQDVEILEIPRREGSSTYEENTTWMAVVLAVTPWDAEKLALAMHVGTIELLGRSAGDTRLATTSGVTQDTLVATGRSAGEPGSNSGTTYRSVELIKGQSRSQERFSLGAGGNWLEHPAEPAGAQGDD